MSWTIPDKGEGVNNIQSILFQEYLDVLVAGLQGLDCVLNGGAITGGADMTPAVAKCGVLSNRAMFAVAAADVTIGAADATNPRLDLIVVNNAGALAVRAGTAAAAPKPPARSANDVVLGVVYVAANDTAIATTEITDLRVFAHSPITLLRQTTQKVQANSVATVSIFNTAPTIPSGLFLAGRILRVRAWGNFLHNNTTSSSIVVRILYGGTVIFQDATAVFGTTADTDRNAWTLEFDLIAQGSAVQVMGGRWLNQATTPAAPTTGIGDLATDEIMATSPLGSATGGIAVDSDTANRVLDIDFDMSTALATFEWVCQGITVELL
jgi:hypothetical protein